MYVLHGLSGIGLVGLTIAHIYFAIRPEKIWITKGMVFGDISREDFLKHHDPQRWVVESAAHAKSLESPCHSGEGAGAQGILLKRILCALAPLRLS